MGFANLETGGHMLILFHALTNAHTKKLMTQIRDDAMHVCLRFEGSDIAGNKTHL